MFTQFLGDLKQRVIFQMQKECGFKVKKREKTVEINPVIGCFYSKNSLYGEGVFSFLQ